MSEDCMHKWKYSQHDLVRKCKLCPLREVRTWIQIPIECEVHVSD